MSRVSSIGNWASPSPPPPSFFPLPSEPRDAGDTFAAAALGAGVPRDSAAFFAFLCPGLLPSRSHASSPPRLPPEPPPLRFDAALRAASSSSYACFSSANRSRSAAAVASKAARSSSAAAFHASPTSRPSSANESEPPLATASAWISGRRFLEKYMNAVCGGFGAFGSFGLLLLRRLALGPAVARRRRGRRRGGGSSSKCAFSLRLRLLGSAAAEERSAATAALRSSSRMSRSARQPPRPSAPAICSATKAACSPTSSARSFSPADGAALRPTTCFVSCLSVSAPFSASSAMHRAATAVFRRNAAKVGPYCASAESSR